MYKYLIILLAVISLVGCGKEHNVRIINNIEKATVTIDGEEQSSIRIGYAKFILSSGEHTVVINKRSADGEWLYRGEKTFILNNDNPTNIEVETKKSETQKRKNRLKKEKEEKEAREKQLEYEKEQKRIALWNSKNIFVDTRSNLIWQNEYIPELLQPEAERYCSNLEFAKNKNWRLPTIAELRSLHGSALEVKEGSNTYISSIDQFTVNISDRRNSKAWHNVSYLTRCVQDSKNKQVDEKRLAALFNMKEYPKDIFLDEKNMLLWENPIYLNRYDDIKIAKTYCKRLNLGGYKMWRLPTREELRYLQTKRPGNINMPGDGFFSSEHIKNNSYNWSVSSNGNDYSSRLANYRCTRALNEKVAILKKKKLAKQRIADRKARKLAKKLSIAKLVGLKNYPKGVYIDKNNKLVWEDPKNIRGHLVLFNDAKNYCKNLSLGGINDWRLPTLKELYSVYEKKRKYNFKSNPTYKVWSSTYRSKKSYDGLPRIWTADTRGNSVSRYFSNMESTNIVRCVR